jgi:hypothetical protein
VSERSLRRSALLALADDLGFPAVGDETGMRGFQGLAHEALDCPRL